MIDQALTGVGKNEHNKNLNASLKRGRPLICTVFSICVKANRGGWVIRNGPSK